MSANICQLWRRFDRCGMMKDEYTVVYDNRIYSSGTSDRRYTIKCKMIKKHFDFTQNCKYVFVLRSSSGRKMAYVYSNTMLSTYDEIYYNTASASAPAPAPADTELVAPAPAPADTELVAPAPAPADTELVAPAPAPADTELVAPAPAPSPSESDGDIPIDVINLLKFPHLDIFNTSLDGGFLAFWRKPFAIPFDFYFDEFEFWEWVDKCSNLGYFYNPRDQNIEK